MTSPAHERVFLSAGIASPRRYVIPRSRACSLRGSHLFQRPHKLLLARSPGETPSAFLRKLQLAAALFERTGFHLQIDLRVDLGPWSFARNAFATPWRSRPSVPMDTSPSVPSKTFVPGSDRRPLADVGVEGQCLARARESATEFRAPHERRRLSCRISVRPSRGLPGQLPKRTLHFIVRHAIDFSPSDEATVYGFVDG